MIPTGAKTATAQGTLNFFDSNVDIMSGTVTLKAPIRNADLALWPGQYVDIELFYEPLHDMMVVPTVAVESGQDSPFVYLVKPDNTIELRKVAVAASEGAKTAIASGLAAGERVVVDGQGGLTNGSRVRDATQRADADARPFAASPATN